MHVSPKELNAYPWYLRPFFWNQRRRYGKVLQPGLLWARLPIVFVPLALLYGAISRKKSKVPANLRSLVTVRVSQINWCAFCVDINSATLLKAGVSEEKVAALAEWRGSALFTSMEKAAIAFAEAMTIPGTNPEEMPIADLRTYLDDDAIVELTAIIAFQNMSSKFNAALNVPPQGFCDLQKSSGKQMAQS